MLFPVHKRRKLALGNYAHMYYPIRNNNGIDIDLTSIQSIPLSFLTGLYIMKRERTMEINTDARMNKRIR